MEGERMESGPLLLFDSEEEVEGKEEVEERMSVLRWTCGDTDGREAPGSRRGGIYLPLPPLGPPRLPLPEDELLPFRFISLLPAALTTAVA